MVVEWVPWALGAGFTAVDRLLSRCPAAPPCPQCPPCSVALTCSGPSSTGAISTEGLAWPSVLSALVVGIFLGIAGARWSSVSREPCALRPSSPTVLSPLGSPTPSGATTPSALKNRLYG
jgi:hypothetical protein